MLGSSLAFVDVSVVIVALPAIDEDLGLGLAGEQWVYASFSLSLAALYLVGGAVGDRYGRRTTFVAGTVGFALASLLAGLAPDEVTLIVARALQGVAGAFLTTNSLALLRAVYADEAGRAIGLWTSFTGVATIAAPPAGGALAEWASWRWIFLLNLPLAAAAVALAVAGRCEERGALRTGRLDLPGAVLAAAGLGALTYGLVEGAERGFDEVWWSLVLAGIALAAFVVVERRVREPLLPFELFRVRNFGAANAETFLVYAALNASMLFLAIYLQFLGFSAFEAGLVFVPTSVVLILLSARFGRIADRRGPRLPLVGGPALMAVGMVLFAPVEERSDFWTVGMAGLLLFSFGLAATVAPITATALSAAPSQYAGIAAGVNSTVSRVGGLLAVAVVGLVVSIVFEGRADVEGAQPLAVGQRDPELRAASVDAFRAATLLCAGLALAGAAVGAVGISNAEAKRRGEATEAAPA